jgi:hypothetical protein
MFKRHNDEYQYLVYRFIKKLRIFSRISEENCVVKIKEGASGFCLAMVVLLMMFILGKSEMK